MSTKVTTPTAFISYAHGGRDTDDLVLHLANRLRGDGVDCTLDQYETFPRQGWTLWMQGQIEASQFVLIVCTETYRRRAEGKEDIGRGLGSQWEAKLIRQLLYNAAGMNGKFIPLLLTISDRPHIPLALQDYTYFCVDTDKGYHELLGILTGQPLISKPPLQSTIQFPGRDRQPDYNNYVWNVPYARNTFFTGRENYLDELHSTLIGSQVPSIQAISGLGGVGKSHLALEFAYRERTRFTGILWLNASSSLGFAAGVREIALLLNLPEACAEDQRATFGAVRQWLKENSGWLLVVDDVTEPTLIQTILPSVLNGSVLLTSRTSNFRPVPIAKPIILDVLRENEGVTFLFAATGRTPVDPAEIVTARKLVSELGGLPLALEQSAAYIVAMQSRFGDYLTGYKSARLATLAKGRARTGATSIHTTWKLNIEAVKQECPAAADILVASAFLSPDQIPLDLFVRGAADFGPAISNSLAPATRTDPLAADMLIAPLLRFSLIYKHLESGTFSIHPLLQEVIREQLSDPARRGWLRRVIALLGDPDIDRTDRLWVGRIVRALSTGFPSADYQDWAICDLLAPQVVHIAELIEPMGLSSPEAGKVLFKTGMYLKKRSRFQESARMLRYALVNAKKACPVDISAILDTLGTVYTMQGNYSEAESSLRKAIASRKRATGQGQRTELAKSVNNLAVLLINLGRKPEAESLLGQVLHDALFDESTVEAAGVLQNLADLKREAGLYSESESLYLRAIRIKRRLLQTSHPDLGQGLNNLALLYRTQKRLADAEPLQEEALQILEKGLGPEHRDVASCLTNLGVLYWSQGKYEQAEQALLRAYPIFEKVHARDHPDYAQAIGSLGIVYTDQERFAEAERLLSRAIKIQEETLGPEHSTLCRLLNAIAALYWRLGRYPETESYMKRALAIGEKSLGPHHPELATALANYAMLLRATGRITEAVDIEARVRNIMRSAT